MKTDTLAFMGETYSADMDRLKFFSGDTANAIAFDRVSGQTHFLSFLAMAVYRAVDGRSYRIIDLGLRDEIAAAVGVAPADLSLADIRRVAGELDALGLISLSAGGAER